MNTPGKVLRGRPNQFHWLNRHVAIKGVPRYLFLDSSSRLYLRLVLVSWMVFDQGKETPKRKYSAVRIKRRFYFFGLGLRTSPQFGNALSPGGKVSCFSPVPSALIRMSWN